MKTITNTLTNLNNKGLNVTDFNIKNQTATFECECLVTFALKTECLTTCFFSSQFLDDRDILIEKHSPVNNKQRVQKSKMDLFNKEYEVLKNEFKKDIEIYIIKTLAAC